MSRSTAASLPKDADKTSATKRSSTTKRSSNARRSRKATLDRDLLYKNLERILLYRATPLTRTEEPYVSKEELLRDWSVAVQGLDLQTGLPRRHGQAYIEPIEPSLVEEWLQAHQPWREASREPFPFELHDDYDPSPEGDMGYPESMEIHEVVMHHLQLFGPESGHKDGILQHRTNWRPWHGDWRPFHDVGEYTISWERSSIHHQCRDADRDELFGTFTRAKGGKPHLICFIHNDAPLVDDGSLSTAELITIVILAIYAATRPCNARFHVMPITLISGSRRSIRIVQGCVDFRRLQFDIRCSPIMDFRDGLYRTESNKRNFLTLLGWVLGNPVGKLKRPLPSTGKA